MLSGGRLKEALSALDGYDASFPHGVLAQEAEAMRIDALVRSGQSSAANARASRFLALHPDSPQAPRVRALIAAGAQDQ
jgi:outer membrane protein assembly factor BamD (BamD/ComL family)